jgi:hypothetical protein
MLRCGEDPNFSDADVLEMHAEKEWRPSAFYKLLEHAGPASALEVLGEAEVALPRIRQPRQKDAAQLAKERERQVRHDFSDTWHFVQGNHAVRSLLEKVEKEAARAFGPSDGKPVALMWMLHWDGAELQSRFGSPPAQEMAIAGLTPTLRKVAHQLARTLGLHSESRSIGSTSCDDNKTVAIRPPRRHACEGNDWIAPFSVTKVISSL